MSSKLKFKQKMKSPSVRFSLVVVSALSSVQCFKNGS